MLLVVVVAVLAASVGAVFLVRRAPTHDKTPADASPLAFQPQVPGLTPVKSKAMIDRCVLAWKTDPRWRDALDMDFSLDLSQQRIYNMSDTRVGTVIYSLSRTAGGVCYLGRPDRKPSDQANFYAVQSSWPAEWLTAAVSVDFSSDGPPYPNPEKQRYYVLGGRALTRVKKVVVDAPGGPVSAPVRNGTYILSFGYPIDARLGAALSKLRIRGYDAAGRQIVDYVQNSDSDRCFVLPNGTHFGDTRNNAVCRPAVHWQ